MLVKGGHDLVDGRAITIHEFSQRSGPRVPLVFTMKAENLACNGYRVSSRDAHNTQAAVTGRRRDGNDGISKIQVLCS